MLDGVGNIDKKTFLEANDDRYKDLRNVQEADVADELGARDIESH